MDPSMKKVARQPRRSRASRKAGVDRRAGPSSKIRAERALGLFQEGRLQRAFLDHRTVLQFWNIYYGTIHFAVPVLALWLLWRRRPEGYPRARTVFLVMCFGALVVFALYPLAPPR